MVRHALGRPTSLLTAPNSPSSAAAAAAPRCDRRRSVSAVLVGATALGSAAFLPGLAAAAPPTDSHCTSSGTGAGATTTCTYTAADGPTDFVAPTGISTFDVTVTGASGGVGGRYFATQTPAGTPGGVGTKLTGTVTVGQNRTYELLVGAKGADGGSFDSGYTSPTGGTGAGRGGDGGSGSSTSYAQGGGGGGASSITSSGGTAIVAAGGGGGGGGARQPVGAGIAGGAAQPSGATTGSRNGGTGTATTGSRSGGGGGGGGLLGGAGGTGGAANNTPGTGGTAGTSSAFGTASTGTTGSDGSVVITYRTPSTSRTGADIVTTIDAPDAVAVGEEATITVTVRNDGSVTAAAVRTRVSIPSGLRLVDGDVRKPVAASLAPGASVVYTYEVVGTKQRPRVPITAVSTSRTTDADPRDNHDTEYIVVGGGQTPALPR